MFAVSYLREAFHTDGLYVYEVLNNCFKSKALYGIQEYCMPLKNDTHPSTAKRRYHQTMFRHEQKIGILSYLPVLSIAAIAP